MDNKKTIRFLDGKYRDLFTIEDGEEIIVTLSTGETKTYQCFYEDIFHFRIKGGSVYHIDQFVEIMVRNGNTYAPANRPLPERPVITKECVITFEGDHRPRQFKWTVTGIDAERCINEIRSNERTEHTKYTKKLFMSWYDCEATVAEIDMDGNVIPDAGCEPVSKANLPDGAVVLEGEIPYKLDALYDMVAQAYGYSEEAIGKMKYAPDKILVSNHILDQQYAAAEDAEINSTEYTMYQANSGPKSNKALKGNAVVVQDGFFH